MKITDQICLQCNLHESCVNPKIKGVSGSNIKAVIILPFPEIEDDLGSPFTGKRAQIVKDCIGEDRLDQVYITYLMKCPAYENPISRSKFRIHNEEEAAHCLKHLARELKAFVGLPIMTFGSFSLQTVCGDKDLKITTQAGMHRKAKIGAFQYDLIPNVDPGAIKHNPMLLNELKSHIDKLFSFSEDSNTKIDVSSRYKLLNYEEAMKEMDKVIDLYQHGEIPWIIFDYETSVSLDPWGGGEIIMSSFAHILDEPGYVVPFYITNAIHHFEYHPKDEFSLDEYMEKFPHNYKWLREDSHVFKLPAPTVEDPKAFTKVKKDCWILPAMPYDVPPVEFQITESQRIKLMDKTRDMVESVPIGGHHLKYDMKWGAWKGKINLRKVKIYNDTLNTSFQLNNKGPGIDNSLKGQSRKSLNVIDDWERKIDDYLSRFRKNEDKHFGMIPTGVLSEYSGLDSYYNRELLLFYESIMPEELKPITEMVTSAVIPYADSEVKGVAIDPQMYGFLKNNYEKYLEAKTEVIQQLPMVKKLIGKYFPPLEEKNRNKKNPLTMEELRWEAFNFGYWKKVSELCYDIYQLPKIKYFKSDAGNYGCNADMREYMLDKILTDEGFAEVKRHDKLDKLALWTEAKDFLKLFGDYKRIDKLYTDYIMTMPDSMHDGIYKTSFNLNGTTTGRLSSPIHSLPKGCDIKRLITSRWREEGGLIMAADYSQIELRVAASLSGETKLIEAFLQGLDAHAVTASEVYGIPLDQVTDAQRNVGKTCNFAMLYGKTKYNLAKDLGISVPEADRILKTFYAKLEYFTAWSEERYKETRESGYVVTVTGRRIPIPNAMSDDEYDMAETKRLSTNYNIQSPSSDLVFDSSMRIWNRKEREGLKSIFLMTVHDSNEQDTFPKELMRLMTIFKEEGQDRIPELFPWVICPMKLDFEIGTSWGGALKCELEELSESRVVLKAKGLKRDFKSMENVARRCYHVNIDNIKETAIDLNTFGDDIFVRDRLKWAATVTLEL